MKQINKHIALLPLIMAAVVLLDQVIKALIVRKLPLWESTPSVLGFRLHYTQNTGAAFSFLREHPQVLAVFIGAILLGCIVYLFIGKERPYSQSVCLALICAGGLGNLIDRIAYGYVVDYIEPTFVSFAIFNFADMVLTCSVAVWAVLLFRQTLRERKSPAK
ncbi:MAG: signal peptidase II [Oscillospiraceae bacterium]|jgi:signal peptidase II|nr:signal peptidase II [Oscillospiraceae bacterium]